LSEVSTTSVPGTDRVTITAASGSPFASVTRISPAGARPGNKQQMTKKMRAIPGFYI
jgi:hypothetical protein